MELTEIIRKHALKNAFEYGKAQAGGVVGKVIADCPQAKMDMKATMKLIAQTVAEVNALAKDAVAEEMKNFEYAEHAQREGLPDLEGFDGKPANTRFAPNPSGFMTIGHSKVAVLCDEYSKKYPGKFWLRFDDTDPKTKKPLPEAYAQTVEDVQWLGCAIEGVIKQSERMPLYYEYAEKLLREGKAYVCTCSREELQDNRREGEACSCRERSGGLEEWRKMKEAYKEGEAVLRLKTDFSHPNSSVRDWVMFRIIEEPHPLTGNKYRVWPLYNFASAVDDHEFNITLIIRGKEHELNAIKQDMLSDAFGWPRPRVLVVGILKASAEFAHKTDIRNAIASGALSGWDDPRAPTVMGFRKRGVPAEAIRAYVIASGIGNTDSSLDVKKLESFARKIYAAEHAGPAAPQ